MTTTVLTGDAGLASQGLISEEIETAQAAAAGAETRSPRSTRSSPR
jgi:hypothetical protein